MSEKPRPEKEKRIEKVFRLLLELIARDYYGKAIISFEAGNAVNLKKEESVKI